MRGIVEAVVEEEDVLLVVLLLVLIFRDPSNVYSVVVFTLLMGDIVLVNL